MLYQCPKCKAIFDEDDVNKETDYEYYEFWGFKGKQELVYWYCPECGEDISDDDVYNEDEEDEEQ